jgi:hypothetical protein
MNDLVHSNTCSIRGSVLCMAITRRPTHRDHITGARIAGAASRHASRQPLDIAAAVAELREIADGRGDLLAARSWGDIRLSRSRRTRRPVASQGARGGIVHCRRRRPGIAHRMDCRGAAASGTDPLRRGANRETPRAPAIIRPPPAPVGISDLRGRVRRTEARPRGRRQGDGRACPGPRGSDGAGVSRRRPSPRVRVGGEAPDCRSRGSLTAPASVATAAN